MAKKLLATISGVKVWWDGTNITFTAGMTIDADGSPRAYGPNNSGLDYTANAGHPGNWWGIVTKAGIPVIQSKGAPQHPFNGMYISTTSLVRKQYGTQDCRRYIDSEKVPFTVLPPQIIAAVAPIVVGCQCSIRNPANGKVVAAVMCDIGPKSHIGEGSMAAAKALGINPNPKSGGTSKPIEYTITPGVAAVVNGETFVLQPS